MLYKMWKVSKNYETSLFIADIDCSSSRVFSVAMNDASLVTSDRQSPFTLHALCRLLSCTTTQNYRYPDKVFEIQNHNDVYHVESSISSNQYLL